MRSLLPNEQSSEQTPGRYGDDFLDVTTGESGSKRRKPSESETTDPKIGGSPRVMEHMDRYGSFEGAEGGELFQGSKRRRRSTEQVQQGYKWSKEEEAFLVGAVMQRFFSYGSLTSSRRTEEDNVWEYIKNVFDERREKYSQAIGKLPPRERTQNALQRHWKLMKSSSNRSFYSLYKLWEKLYSEACGPPYP